MWQIHNKNQVLSIIMAYLVVTEGWVSRNQALQLTINKIITKVVVLAIRIKVEVHLERDPKVPIIIIRWVIHRLPEEVLSQI